MTDLSLEARILRLMDVKPVRVNADGTTEEVEFEDLSLEELEMYAGDWEAVGEQEQ